MVVPGLMVSLGATGCGLWALVLLARANPGAAVPVVSRRGAVDPDRARGLRAAMAALSVMAAYLAGSELGWAALWLVGPPVLLPLLAALVYNTWLRRAGHCRA